ncbi:MAG: DUF1018 domain-containing protein [Ignavibacteriae bacterium]|nr:DUF1018 domain-containing protein [Ignavibacteriota bacterium]
MKIAKNQLAKIHIAKKELKLNDDNYRILLSNFNVISSKDLSFNDAEQLLKIFIQLGWKPKEKELKKEKDLENKTKYDELNPRPFGFASPGQLRKIEAMYHDLSKSNSNEGLNKLIKRIVKIDHITWLKKKDVPKILKCLDEIKLSQKTKREKRKLVNEN